MTTGWQDQMDEAARAAERELGDIPDSALQAVSEWWAKWYRTAGHKRLGRLLVKFATTGLDDETDDQQALL